MILGLNIQYGLYNIVYTSFDKQNPLLWDIRDR